MARASGDSSAQLAHETLDALVAARETVAVDQILPECRVQYYAE